MHQELEEACRKCVRIEVNHAGKLARVFHERQIEYQMLSETEAEIYADMSVTKLVLMLAEEDCEVLSVKSRTRVWRVII